jgi:hypothetical protein
MVVAPVSNSVYRLARCTCGSSIVVRTIAACSPVGPRRSGYSGPGASSRRTARRSPSLPTVGHDGRLIDAAYVDLVFGYESNPALTNLPVPVSLASAGSETVAFQRKTHETPLARKPGEKSEFCPHLSKSSRR